MSDFTFHQQVFGKKTCLLKMTKNVVLSPVGMIKLERFKVHTGWSTKNETDAMLDAFVIFEEKKTVEKSIFILMGRVSGVAVPFPTPKSCHGPVDRGSIQRKWQNTPKKFHEGTTVHKKNFIFVRQLAYYNIY